MATRILAIALVSATLAAQSARGQAVNMAVYTVGSGHSTISTDWDFTLDHAHKIVTVHKWHVLEPHSNAVLYSAPLLDHVQFEPYGGVFGYYRHTGAEGWWHFEPQGEFSPHWLLAFYPDPAPPEFTRGTLKSMLVGTPEPTSLALGAAGIALGIVARRRSG
ncbi:MAG: hypothetical protein IT424_06430 [Pirellulales bacterium]|nr:hypothetical protein [Pirellulales bacterium]